MTHKPNRTNLPPAKSADEYEREIAALRARVEELEAWFRLTERPFRKYPSRFVDEDLDESDDAWELHSKLVAALSPKGEATQPTEGDHE